MKKCILFALGMLLFFWQPAWAQDTYFVSPFPIGNEANDGSESNPWPTIKFAVEHVVENEDGIIINITPAGYNEQFFTIDKAMTLQGIGSGAVRIIPNGARASIFAIDASYVTIKNLTIEGSGTVTNGVAINTGNSDITLQNTTVSGADVGVSVGTAVGELTLNNNNLANNTTAAIQNNSAEVIDASFNWWGSREKANVVSQFGNTVDYSPWLNSGADNDPSAVGFQSNFSSVSIDGDSPGEGTLQEAFDLIGANDTLRLIESSSPYDILSADKSIVLATIEGEQPEIEEITVDGEESDILSIDGNMLFSQSVRLLTGTIQTISDGQVLLGEAVGDVNEDNGRLRGNFKTQPRTAGTGSVNVLGVNIASGPDDLGEVTITRLNGPAGIVEANDNESIAVTWIIDAENQPGNGRTIKFNWRAENDNDKNASEVQVWRLADDSEIWELVTPNAISAPSSGTNVRSVTVNNVREFSSWTISDVEAPLPVTLTDFNAQLEKPSVRLEWATASEDNARFFGIERSTNGFIFEEIARNQAAGTSTALRNYLYVDEGVASRLSGTLYYRLRMVDFDDSFEYSDIIAVPLNDDSDLRVHADANTGTVQLFTQHLPEDQYLVQVSDMLGNVVIESSLATAQESPVFHFPLSSPTHAVYLVRCFGTRTLFTQKFRVE